MTAASLSQPPTLADRLREATRPLHVEVERAGVMQPLLRGTLPLPGYCLLLRNLLVIYEALETALQTAASSAPPATSAALQALVPAVLLRTAALQQDLQFLHGSSWRAALPLATTAQAYARHLQALAGSQPQLLAAHAYVRYLGDLNGGQMLARLVGQALHLPPGQGLAFYRFDGDLAVPQLKADFRQALDLQAADEGATLRMVAEACSAFVRHRELFEELQGLVSMQRP